MSKSKLVLGGVVVLLVVFGLAWAWGSSGRIDVERSLRATEQKLDLSEAKAAVLQARISLYSLNFGDASRLLEESKAPLERAHKRLQDLGQTEAATNVTAALTLIKEAQGLAAKLDQAANSKAAEAIRAIEAAGAAH